MKSEKIGDELMSPEAFWQWFASKAEIIASNPESDEIIDELDRQVKKTWPRLGWEIGPDPSGNWYFALSPNLNRELVGEATDAIHGAPVILGWKFYSARPRKEWGGKFEIEGSNGVMRFDCANWRYILLRHPNGDKELIMIAPETEILEQHDRWQAAAIVIEGLLGEGGFLANVDEFSMESSLDAKLTLQTKPIYELAQAFELPTIR